ncbi:MAG: glycoside hydrolase family 20 zincin-like fold domain-containing protein [candidate division WOR-3 bacterium]
MKTLMAILLFAPLFLFGAEGYGYYMDGQGEGEAYTRPLSDTIPVLVPEPQSIIWFGDSCFYINESTLIAISNPADSVAARFLRDEIIKSCACTLEVVDTLVSEDAIILRRRNDWPVIPFGNQPPPRPQAYTLKINSAYCVITGDDYDGVFYGAMTLKQLIAQHEGDKLAGVWVYDYPHLGFRGTYMAYSGNPDWSDSMKRRADYFAGLKLNKLILESGSFWFTNYPGVIDTFFNRCRKNHIEPIPLLQSFGHAGNVLWRNPACGEAIYRGAEHFCFLSDTAWCLDDTTRFKRPVLLDIGFDSVSGNDFTKWEQTDVGVTIFSDSVNQHAGLGSVKIRRLSNGTSRLWQDIDCGVNALYVLSFFIKIQGVGGIDTLYEGNPVGVYIEVYGNDIPRGWVLIKRSRAMRGTVDWQKVSVVFNSGNYTELRVYVGMYYAQGMAWIDGERLPVIKNAGFEDDIIQAPWVKEPPNADIERTSQEAHTGTYSCMIRNPNAAYTRVYQDIEVEPGYDYRLKVWVKTVDVEGRGCFCTAFWVADTAQYWKGHATREFYGILMSDTVVGSTDWTEVRTNWFSSGHCKKLRIKLALDGTGIGYFDDVVVEKVEKSLVNVDPTTPIKVTSETGTEYESGTDYQIIPGPTLTFPYNLDVNPTKIIRLGGGAISDSQIVLVSYDKLPAFRLKKDPSYYPYCPTKTATRQIMDSAINYVAQWHPQTIHFGHDEIALMKEDQPCLTSGRSRSGLLAYDIDTLFSRLGDTVKMMLWEDMLNYYHLGGFYPDDPTYLAADSIPKNVIPIIWFYGDNEPFGVGDSSITYFGAKGFKSIAAGAGYDILNPYNWSGVIKNHWLTGDTSCYGLINTTWAGYNNFQNSWWRSLPTVLEYSWQWPDTTKGRVWSSKRYEPIILHRNYGDIFVPRPTGLGFEYLVV